MIPSILCYVPPSAEFLVLTTPPVFKPGSMTPQFSNQIDASSSMCVYGPATGVFQRTIHCILLNDVAYSFVMKFHNFVMTFNRLVQSVFKENILKGRYKGSCFEHSSYILENC